MNRNRIEYSPYSKKIGKPKKNRKTQVPPKSKIKKKEAEEWTNEMKLEQNQKQKKQKVINKKRKEYTLIIKLGPKKIK